jgi:ParB family transcriptional regulator, chromosome partitioning protein
MGNLFDKNSIKAKAKGQQKTVGLGDLVRGGDGDDFLNKKKKEGKFLVLPAKDFYPDPDQPRKSFVDSELQELRESIESRGQLQPIAVVLGDRGKYKIVAGERRWRAIKSSESIATIDAVIVDDALDEVEILLMQLDENNKRVEVPILENAAAMKRVVDICKSNGGNQDDAANLLNVAKGQLSKVLSLLDIPKSIETLIVDGVTQDVEAVYNLARAVKKSPEKESEIVELVRNSDVGSLRKLSKSIVEDVTKPVKAKEKRKNEKPEEKVLKTDSVGMVKEGDNFVLAFKSGSKTFKFSLDEEQIKQIKV